jgi:hypothetical protein
MRQSSAGRMLLAACMAALAVSCAAPEPQSGDTRAKQERERGNDPAGPTSRNGGGY